MLFERAAPDCFRRPVAPATEAHHVPCGYGMVGGAVFGLGALRLKGVGSGMGHQAMPLAMAVRVCASASAGIPGPTNEPADSPPRYSR